MADTPARDSSKWPSAGGGCGSAAGVPSGFGGAGRWVELPDPFDQQPGDSALIFGSWGSGKSIRQRDCLAPRARVFVIDRARDAARGERR